MLQQLLSFLTRQITEQLRKLIPLLMLILTGETRVRFGRWKGSGSTLAALLRLVVLGVVLTAWLRAGVVLLLH